MKAAPVVVTTSAIHLAFEYGSGGSSCSSVSTTSLEILGLAALACFLNDGLVESKSVWLPCILCTQLVGLKPEVLATDSFSSSPLPFGRLSVAIFLFLGRLRRIRRNIFLDSLFSLLVWAKRNKGDNRVAFVAVDYQVDQVDQKTRMLQKQEM